MKDQIELSQVLPIVAPILVIQLILMVVALVLCVKSANTRGPKWMWILIILFTNFMGPIAFFIFGRKNEG